MKMKLIEKYTHSEQGYNPFLIREKWQVAQLNYAPEEELNAITCLDIHHHTDEAFILIKGECALIAAEITDGKISYDVQNMQQGTVYNIPTDVWHKIAMKKGSKVIIVENSNTHLPLPEGDYEFYYLNETEINDLRKTVNNIL